MTIDHTDHNARPADDVFAGLDNCKAITDAEFWDKLRSFYQGQDFHTLCPQLGISFSELPHCQ